MYISNLKKLHFVPYMLEEPHKLFTDAEGWNSLWAARYEALLESQWVLVAAWFPAVSLEPYGDLCDKRCLPIFTMEKESH